MAVVPEPGITRIARIGLVVADVVAAEAFFHDAFGFESVERIEGGTAYADLVGVPGAKTRLTKMRLGAQEILLVGFEKPGRPYPQASTSTDLWFQHFAIIVSDMEAAYERLKQAGRFVPISEGGPVQLPEASGGVKAFKFRDADGHPLELLAFPPDGAPPAWRDKSGLFLGIDHSAIAVADTEVSVGFFEYCFGLERAMQNENVGDEQARMDAVPDARVIVTGLAPKEPPPHLELLGYKVGERRPIDAATRSSDIAASFFVLEATKLEPVIEAMSARATTFVSPGIVTFADGVRAIMVLDPDGHRFIIEEAHPAG